jgi:hypothetical protein
MPSWGSVFPGKSNLCRAGAQRSRGKATMPSWGSVFPGKDVSGYLLSGWNVVKKNQANAWVGYVCKIA